MNFCNALKSLTWNSFFARSRVRRARRPAFDPLPLAAEVLERRALLAAANVDLSVAAGAITLTSTDGKNSALDVQRVDPTNVEFDPLAGTQITYLGVVETSPFNVALPTVASVTVNLGTGLGTFTIHNLSTSGNITFNGNPVGGAGGNLDVFSESADMVVGGSVIFNLGNQTAGFVLNQRVYTNGSGNFTINGSIQDTEAGVGGTGDQVAIFTQSGSGNLLVNGSVSTNHSGSGSESDAIFTEADGNVTINGSVSFVDSGSGLHINAISTDGSGNVTIGQLVTNTSSGSDLQRFGLFSGPGGNGSVSIGGLNCNFSGSGDRSCFIRTLTSGNITIGALGVTINNSGSGSDFNEIQTESTGAIVIQGSVTVHDNGTGHSEFDLMAEDVSGGSGGSVTVAGSVSFNNSSNSTASDVIQITADTSGGSGVVTIGGALTLLLANDPSAGNLVSLGGGTVVESSPQLTIGGRVRLTSGAGTDTFDVDAVDFRSAVTVNTGTSSSGGGVGDCIFIVDSEFDGPVSITMAGAKAQIDVNAQSGYGPTVFNGPVRVSMQGPGAVIQLSNSTDAGTPVAFNSPLTVIGGQGGTPAGTLFLFGPVHFALPPKLINFAKSP
jgi:hypothetical protein